MQQTNPASTYRQRSESFTAERDRLDRRLRLLAHVRMVVFLTGLVCWLGAWDAGGTLQWLLFAGGLLLLITFLTLVRVNSRLKANRRLQEELREVNEDAGRRLNRAWNELHEPEYAPPEEHPFAADLDLFGHASLMQLLGTAATIPGRDTLRDWLLEPTRRETMLLRQQAVAELAPLIDYRNLLEARGRLVGRERPDALHAFLGWARSPDWILERPLLVWTARLLPLVTVVAFLLDLAGTLAVPVWWLSIAIGIAISIRTYKKIHPVMRLVASGDVGLRRYAPVFESASSRTADSPLLKDMLRVVAPAAPQMRKLDRILSCAEVRYSGMLYAFVQTLFLWDHNVLCALEKWRRDTGPHIEEWVSALGQIEALAALAALSHAHPGWAFPTISRDAEEPFLAAKDIGHPLLPTERCVANDVTVGPPGTFLFVTGSNMSGKSTLLRSIGINAVLAQAGGPVCATELTLPVVSVFTSMRVSDSLDLGISQYMAQLNRLKMIVEGARESAEGDGRPKALYLLDEILQGTNSAERLIAARRIVRRLIDCGAIGAVTSHELTVPDVPELSETAQIVHFRETAERTTEGVTLAFDYKLRPGLSTSTNALKLMEMIGLD